MFMPTEFKQELARVDNEQKLVREKIVAEASDMSAISAYQDIRADMKQKHGIVRSQYATYSSMKEVSDLMDSMTKSLKPMRPPTAPAEDLAAEKAAILRGSGPSFLLLQIALALVLVSMLVYVFVPFKYAHPIVFLVLSVGIAVGIFLKK
jgi:hypothetical protein